MFESNKFAYTRGDNGGLNILNYTDQYEVTNVYEDPEELESYNRAVLRDRSNPRGGLDHEAPRINTGAKWKLNLNHDGVYGATELPYVHDEYDLSFRDHDPRGWNLEQDWKKFRRDGTPRASQTLWGKDDDLSIPGEGIAPVDMVSRLVELRRSLRDRINWFSESLGNFAAGKMGGATNAPNDLGVVTLEDKSQAIDPSMFDSVSTQNLNRYLSNNLHLGGAYFLDRTTPDHVLPIASYGYLFRSMRPGSFSQNVDRGLTEEIKTLNIKSSGKNFIKFLESYDQKKNMTLDGKRSSLLRETDNRACSDSDRTKKDILALLGITQNEIRWLNSKQNINREGSKECLANIVSMISGLEKLPPNALLNIRDGLLREHAPEFSGGVCKNTDFKKKMARLLEGRGSVHANNKKGNEAIWKSINTSRPSHKLREGVKNNSRGLGSVVSSLFGVNTDQVETYSKISAKKSGAVFGMRRAQTESDKFDTDSITTQTNAHSGKTIKTDISKEDNDTDFGRELVFEQEIKSWNESHLIPKQIKK